MALRGRGVLLYDGDCGFCTATARWLEERLGSPAGSVTVRPWRDADADRYGVTPADADREIHWIDHNGGVLGGADAVLAWWRTGRPGWQVLASVLGAPGLRVSARLGYRVIARHRHRLPGGPSCTLPAQV